MNINEFDDLMKDKLEEKEFSFSESNWEKAAKLIDASRPAKKPLGGMFWSVIIVGTLGILVGGIYFFGTSNESNGNMANVEVNKEKTNVKVYGNSTLTNETKEASEINLVKKENELFAENNSESKESNNTVKNDEVAGTAEKAKMTEDVSNMVNKMVKEMKPITTTRFSSMNSKTDYAVNKNESFSEKSNTVVTEDAMENIPDANLNAQVNLIPDYIQPISINQLSGSNENIPDANFISDYNSLEMLNKDYVKLKRHTLNIEAGAINSLGWKVNNKRNGNSLTPLFGFNYIYNFTAKSAMLIGAQYNSLSNITESNVSFSITSFGFDASSNITTYKITELQYLTVPVKYIHKLAKNSFIGAGVNLTYLLNTKNRIEVYSKEDNYTRQVNTYNDNGFGRDITENYNAQLALSYSHKFNKHLGMNVEVNKNLRNVFTDYSAFSLSKVSNKPTSIKISLTYMLFNK